MRKFIPLLVAIAVIASVILAGCTPAPTGAPVEFKFNIQAPGAAQPSVYEPTERYVKDVAAKTQGRVKITVFYNFGLAPGPETFDATIKGVCDLGESNTGYTPGRFPYFDATILPIGYPNSYVQSRTMMDFYDNFKPKEFDEVIPLDFISPPPFWIGTVNKAVRSVDDFKGLQVRVTSKSAADLFTLFGAAPRVVPISDTYELLSKGVMDGVIAGPEAFPGFKFNEVCKYFTDITCVAMGNCSYLVANKGTWAKLSSQDQQIMRDASRAFGLDRAITWDKVNDAEIINFKKLAGKESIYLPDSEQAKMRNIAKKVADDWVTSSTAKGVPAADLVKFVKDRIDYWSKQPKPQ